MSVNLCEKTVFDRLFGVTARHPSISSRLKCCIIGRRDQIVGQKDLDYISVTDNMIIDTFEVGHINKIPDILTDYSKTNTLKSV